MNNDKKASSKDKMCSNLYHEELIDMVLPFTVEDLHIRGRIVTLGPTINQILSRHNYPEPIAFLLAKILTVTTLIGSSLKFSGKITLQIHSDSVIKLLVCDLKNTSDLRAYARFDKKILEQKIKEKKTEFKNLLENGKLVLTLDHGQNTQLYQAIVDLEGESIEEIIENYFLQSEQIPTKICLATAKLTQTQDNKQAYRAGGIFIQHLPQNSFKKKTETAYEYRNDHDLFFEAQALLETIEPSELIDPMVGAKTLLFRLFHHYETRIFDPITLKDQCSCSLKKIQALLQNFSKEECEDSIENDVIDVLCEFCAKHYIFDPKTLLPIKGK